MTEKDIVRLAEESGLWLHTDRKYEAVEKFAKLVAAEEREATSSAYKERNQLVALLSTCFPSGKAKTAIEGWDEAWHGCVYIEFPWGQASWHYHNSDAWMFEHLPPYNKQWDGHTTEQKYAGIAAAIRARGLDNLNKEAEQNGEQL
jgi:hypothetical protein